jgi:SAM-dependent methyltransferase
VAIVKGLVRGSGFLDSFKANAVRLQLHALAYNLANFLRTWHCLRCKSPRMAGTLPARWPDWPVISDCRLVKGERLAISLSDRVERLERAFWHTLDVAYTASLPFRTIRCIVCDHESKREGFGIVTDTCQFGGGTLERYCCPACDCIFGPLKYLDLPDDFVSGDYALLYATYSEADSTEREIRTFRSLAPEPSGLYLDWGCGGAWSGTVDRLRGEGFDMWGYEPCAESPGQFVVNKREAISARFDGIFSNNVIEHFRDPVAQFRDFHTILKDGGRMAHASPCYEYSFAYTRFHSLFLLGRSPHVLAERTGFRISNQVRDGKYINLVFDRIGTPGHDPAPR